LDELDIRIVRELTQGGNVGLAWGEISPSYSRIGTKLGVSRETVRERVEKMSRSGFLKAFPIQVNPTLLGLKIGALSVDLPPTAQKARILEELSLVDGMILVATHVSSMVGVSFYYEDERALEKKISLISRICGATRTRFTTVPIPPCSLVLSMRDWEIVAALQRRRTRPAGEIAKELGISKRTLKRRTKRMIDGMAISTLVSSEIGALSGGIMGNLQVDYNSAKTRPETDGRLLQQLDHSMIYAGLWPGFALFTLVLPNIRSASEILNKVRMTKGVAQARLDLIEERVEVYSTLNEPVERRIRSQPLIGARR